ncbi:MAG: hypothetical protein KDK91_08355, partial [Gammaproteobacteria bacterium]|nr:hypothetical protein [Gammaproteobacteria bacterium]
MKDRMRSVSGRRRFRHALTAWLTTAAYLVTPQVGALGLLQEGLLRDTRSMAEPLLSESYAAQTRVTTSKADLADSLTDVVLTPAGSVDDDGPDVEAVATLELELERRVYAPGERVGYTIRAFDNHGNPVPEPGATLVPDNPVAFDRPIGSDPPVALDSNEAGALIALLPGIHTLRAVAGGLVSEAVHVHVVDPTDKVLDTVSGQVVFPAAFDPVNTVVRGPSGRIRALRADFSFEIERKRYRNQLVSVLDAVSGETLLMAIVPGSVDGEPDRALTVDVQSTAEALAFFSPQTLSAEPAAFRAFRSGVEQSGALLPVAAEIERQWMEQRSWIGQRVALEQPLALALDGIRSVLGGPRDGADPADPSDVLHAQALTPATEEMNGCTRLVAHPGDFRPGGRPALVDGMTTIATPTAPSTATVQFTNYRKRRLSLYVEEVPADGTRPDDVQDRAELIHVGSRTAFASVGKSLSGGLGEFFSPSCVQFDLDFGSAASDTRYRLFAYGPGLGSNVADEYKDDTLRFLQRSADPWARTFAFDVVANTVSVVSTIDKEIISEPVIQVFNRLSYALHSGELSDAFRRAYESNNGWGDFAGLVEDLAINIMLDLLKTVPVTVAKGIATEVAEKSTIVLDVYAMLVSTLEILEATGDFFASEAVSMIDVVDEYATILPERDGIEDAPVQCRFEKPLKIVGGHGPYEWVLGDGAPDGLRLELLPDPEGRLAKLVVDRFPAPVGEVHSFWVRAFKPATEHEERFEVANQVYSLKAVPAAPNVVSIRFENDSARVEPGGSLDLEVVASHCGGADEIVAGSLYGSPIAASKVSVDKVLDPVSRLLKATLTVPVPYEDTPSNPLREWFTVVVKDVDGGTGTRNAIVDVTNLAPAKVEAVYESGSSIEVYPGGRFSLKVDVTDENYDGEPEVSAAAVTASRLIGRLDVTPMLSDQFEFVRVESKPARGLQRFQSKSRLTLDAVHPDNDGTKAGKDVGDRPALIAIKVEDDDGNVEPGSRLAFPSSGVVEVLVRNVAPRFFTQPSLSPQVLSPKRVGVPRPVRVSVWLSDSNGFEDIGEVTVTASWNETLRMSRGFTRGRDRARFDALYDDVPPSCAQVACWVQVTVRDADDEPDNNGLTVGKRIPLAEGNLPPKSSGDAMVIPEYAPSGDVCEGSVLTFGVIASDPNEDELEAWVMIPDYVALKLTRRGKHSYVASIQAPPARQRWYDYHFIIKEKGTLASNTLRVPANPIYDFYFFSRDCCDEPVETAFTVGSGTGPLVAGDGFVAWYEDAGPLAPALGVYDLQTCEAREFVLPGAPEQLAIRDAMVGGVVREVEGGSRGFELDLLAPDAQPTLLGADNVTAVAADATHLLFVTTDTQGSHLSLRERSDGSEVLIDSRPVLDGAELLLPDDTLMPRTGIEAVAFGQEPAAGADDAVSLAPHQEMSPEMFPEMPGQMIVSEDGLAVWIEQGQV